VTIYPRLVAGVGVAALQWFSRERQPSGDEGHRQPQLPLERDACARMNFHQRCHKELGGSGAKNKPSFH